MTEPMVTDEDREIARRWLSEGQINVDQMGRAAVLVAIRQEYQAVLAAERDGDVLVPKEPTEEMVKAGKEMMPVEYDYEQITFWDGTEYKTLMVVKGIAPYWKHQDPAEVYRAMIAAAIRARGR